MALFVSFRHSFNFTDPLVFLWAKFCNPEFKGSPRTCTLKRGTFRSTAKIGQINRHISACARYEVNHYLHIEIAYRLSTITGNDDLEWPWTV